MMKTRVVVGIVLTPLLFVVLYFTPPVVLPLAISLISVLAVHELLGVVNYVRKMRLMVYSLLYTAFLPIADYFEVPIQIEFFVTFVFIAMLFVEGLLDPERISFEIVAGSFMASYMIPVFFSSVMHVFMLDDGKFTVLLIFIIPIMTDIFAMSAGTLFGKRKLIPEISPKKTVEGSVGGILGSLIFSVVYGLILSHIFGFYVDFVLIVVLSIVGSIVAQLGDLSLSFIKRGFKVKDFGTILPGHGGILDRFDSILFVCPLVEVTLASVDVIWR